MKLITFNRREDFGVDYYTQILNIKGWSLLQVSVSWNDYPGMPYLQITFGSNGFFSFLFWCYKFGLDIDLLSRTWRWDYLDKIEEEDETPA
jgi:hypothetical protein